MNIDTIKYPYLYKLINQIENEVSQSNVRVKVSQENQKDVRVHELKNTLQEMKKEGLI